MPGPGIHLDKGEPDLVHPRGLIYDEGMIFYFHSSGYWSTASRTIVTLAALGLVFSWWMSSPAGLASSLIGLIIGLVFFNMSSKSLAYAQVNPAGLTVRMGLLFHRRFPWPDIINAAAATHSLRQGLGVRLGGDKTIALVTSSSNIVQVNFSRDYSWLFFRFSHLKLSLENAAGFSARVNTRR